MLKCMLDEYRAANVSLQLASPREVKMYATEDVGAHTSIKTNNDSFIIC